MRFAEQGQVDSERSVGGFGAADGLEYQIDGCAGVEGFELRRDMRQYAALRRDVVALANGVSMTSNFFYGLRIIGSGVDADDGVATAEHETVEMLAAIRARHQMDGWVGGGG